MTIESPKRVEPVRTDITQERIDGTLPPMLDVDRVHVYLGRDDEYHWRRRSGGNFAVIATNAEGHPDADHALDMALRCNATPFILTVDLGDAVDKLQGRVWLVEAPA